MPTTVNKYIKRLLKSHARVKILVGANVPQEIKKGDYMKRSDLIEEFANKFNITKKECEERVDWLEEKIIKVVKSGDEIILNIGKFAMKKVPARTGRNPKTGETMKIAAKKKPVFKPAKKFKDALS